MNATCLRQTNVFSRDNVCAFTKKCGGAFHRILKVNGPLMISERAVGPYYLPSGRPDLFRRSQNEELCFNAPGVVPQIQNAFVFAVAVENFAHFVFDMLPVAAVVWELRRSGVHVEIFVLSYLPVAFRQLIEDLFGSVMIANRNILVSNAFVPCFRGLTNTVNLNAHAWTKRATPPPFHHTMMQRIRSFAISQQKSGSGAARCIYSVRTGVSSQRSIVNSEELQDFLQGHGWALWYPIKYVSFKERASSLGNATEFLALLGADPTNMVFLPLGTSVHILGPAPGAKHAAPIDFYNRELQFYKSFARFLAQKFVVHNVWTLVPPHNETSSRFRGPQYQKHMKRVRRMKDGAHFSMKTMMPDVPNC